MSVFITWFPEKCPMSCSADEIKPNAACKLQFSYMLHFSCNYGFSNVSYFSGSF